MTYTFEYETGDGILVCRMFGLLDEQAARRFNLSMRSEVDAARCHSASIRILIDNSQGRVEAPVAVKMMIEDMRVRTRSGDRIAIVVPNSLGKLNAKRMTTDTQEVFLSEHAARIWLIA